MQGTNNAPQSNRPMIPLPPRGTAILAGMRVAAATRDSFVKDGKTIEYAKVELEIPSDEPGRRYTVTTLPADLEVIPAIIEAMEADRPVTLVARLIKTMDRHKKWVVSLRIIGMLDPAA